jgi:hypothetical protein
MPLAVDGDLILANPLWLFYVFCYTRGGAKPEGKVDEHSRRAY